MDCDAIPLPLALYILPLVKLVSTVMSACGKMGCISCNAVLATVKGAKESWAVISNEPPTLQTLWQYALRFQVEELFLDSKSGAFELEESRVRSTAALERLYLIAAIAILYATTQGMAVQIAGLRQQVDPHWRRGISASQDWLTLVARGAS